VFVVHVVDVGTGLAVFIEGPDFSMLYDGGSNDDLRDEHSNRLTAYLRAVRPDLREIDHVVLSHAHRDHVELLPDVLNEYNVREVWEPGVLAKVCSYQRFVHAVAAHPATKYHTATQAAGIHEVVFPKTSCRVPSEISVTYSSTIVEGSVINLGQRATMTFLHVDSERHENLNENSLVVRLALGDRSVLLVGDAEAGKRNSADVAPLPESAEGRLLARHGKELRSDVLVVGHHGSKTSTRRVFLDAVSPSLSIVSGGPHAYSGHTLPDAEVVDLLAQHGPVFRTDLDDVACATSTAKIGRDADGRPGGCDNIRVTFRPGVEPRGEYWRGHD
jgi:competence protein ComEC